MQQYTVYGLVLPIFERLPSRIDAVLQMEQYTLYCLVLPIYVRPISHQVNVSHGMHAFVDVCLEIDAVNLGNINTRFSMSGLSMDMSQSPVVIVTSNFKLVTVFISFLRGHVQEYYMICRMLHIRTMDGLRV